jgi:hypothetical protein
MSGHQHPQATPSPWMRPPRHPIEMYLGGSQRHSDRFEEEKTLFPYRNRTRSLITVATELPRLRILRVWTILLTDVKLWTGIQLLRTGSSIGLL